VGHDSDTAETFRAMDARNREVRQRAAARRDLELQELEREGVAVRRCSPDHIKVGPLNLWPSTGRWWNEQTQKRGRINGRTIRQVIALSENGGGHTPRRLRKEN
jgi:hypothetical protein